MELKKMKRYVKIESDDELETEKTNPKIFFFARCNSHSQNFAARKLHCLLSYLEQFTPKNLITNNPQKTPRKCNNERGKRSNFQKPRFLFSSQLLKYHFQRNEPTPFFSIVTGTPLIAIRCVFLTTAISIDTMKRFHFELPSVPPFPIFFAIEQQLTKGYV